MKLFRKKLVPTPLDNATYERFKAILHPKQLTIFHEVLQYSLASARGYCSKQILTIDTDKEVKPSFENIVESLYIALSKLNSLFKGQFGWSKGGYTNLFLTILVFYRVLLNPNPKQTYHNSDVIKRIPPKLFYFMGSEYWRLYELYSAALGNIESLALNADLIPILSEIYPNEQEIVTIPDVSNLVEKFTEWLENNLLQHKMEYQLNISYIFVDPLRFDNHTIFITHDCIKHFSQLHTSVDEQHLTGLIQKSYLPKKYYLLDENKLLFSIKTQLDIDQFELIKPATILEKLNAN